MTLDTFQQVTALSFVINRINYFNGTTLALQRILQVGLTSSVFPYVDDKWQLAWGPIVWKHKPDDANSGPDNSSYVAFHPSFEFEDGSVHPTYLITIGGTPERSTYVWINETLAAQAVSDFKAWVDGGVQTSPKAEGAPKVALTPQVPYVSTGTLEAVRTILTTPAPVGAVSAGLSLLEFMRNLNQSSTSHRNIVTGYSLGGALSPTLALALVSAGVIPADITMTYPIAGSSPGNAAFTDLFTKTFPARKSDSASSYKGWNLNLVNKLDPVPNFWSLPIISKEQNLANIPTLYGIPPLPAVVVIATAATVAANASGTLYKPIPSQYFTGPRPSAPPALLSTFVKIVYSQHIDAYPNEVGVTIPWLDKQLITDAGVTEKSETEKWFADPGIANFAWVFENPDQAQQTVKQDQGAAARL